MVTKKNTDAESTELVKEAIPDAGLERLINKKGFQSITSFDDAVRLAEEVYARLVRSDEMGDGFSMLENKDRLIGEPFIIMDSSISFSDKFRDQDGNPSPFVIIRVVTKGDKKYVVVDGSTGICRQVMELIDEHEQRGGFVCLKGLRKSEYTVSQSDGSESEATTYYIDESGL